jgi:ankyrin repeat protein
MAPPLTPEYLPLNCSYMNLPKKGHQEARVTPSRPPFRSNNSMEKALQRYINYAPIKKNRLAENGHEAVVKLLLEAKADVDSKDHDGQTPLLLAALSETRGSRRLALQ